MPLTFSWAQRLAKPLKVLPLDIADSVPGVSDVHLVPVVAWAEAGDTMEAIAARIDDKTRRVAVKSERKQLLAVEVAGNAMNAVAPAGSYIVFDRGDRDLKDGGYFLVRIDGMIEFRRWRSTGGPPRLEAESTEPGHATIYPTGEVEVIGRVIEVVMTLP